MISWLLDFMRKAKTALGRCRPRPHPINKHDLAKQLKKIMATQQEITARLATATAAIKDLGDGVDEIKAEVDNIGKETDASLKLIKDLQDAIANQTGASPELVAAADALEAQLGTSKAAVDAAKVVVKGVDDKIPDAVP